MGKIIRLDKNLANQIAAGEVVERPISIVKELIENSIDAGSDSIKIEIKNGGKSEIIITDNGYGIDKNDLNLAVEKYSTSKIKNLDDLYNIMTFGFRGEALASITSVSKTTIISKTKDSESAYKLEIIGGESGEIIKEMGETGTKIIIRDLFYNTPARLNYLKKDKTEYAHIFDFLQNISLSYPHIGFEFISDNRQVFKYNIGDNLQTRIYHIYGEEVSDNLIDVNFNLGGIEISGFITNPNISFGNKNRQNLFVNNRVIKSPLIYKAITNAYNRFIPHNRFPAYILNLEIDPTQVDVNVHPRKLEVRFANESQIFKSFYNAIYDKLNSFSVVSIHNQVNNNQENNINNTENLEGNNDNIRQEFLNLNNNFSSANTSSVQNNLDKNNNFYTGSGNKFKSYSPYKEIKFNPNQSRITRDFNPFDNPEGSSGNNNLNNIEEGSLETSTDLHDTPLGKIIGQAFNSYIIVETNNSIQVLDQHALAERVIYERLVNSKQKAISQGLLVGESVNLTPKEFNILEHRKAVFEEMGFEVELLSNNIVMINAVPSFIKQHDIKDVFLGVLEDIGEEADSKSKTLDEIRNKIYAFTACRSAIKFGNKLNLFEMNKLLKDSTLDYSSTCPHGRPVSFEIDLHELKNKYER
ncbi:MAG: DNA mismatch repair endonuclease MutL [Candidatus Gracilibacteria bacterium]|nr:DNA mismatch repair endonuclease MutL [Candidatus Gracilibacteria bacterium]